MAGATFLRVALEDIGRVEPKAPASHLGAMPTQRFHLDHTDFFALLKTRDWQSTSDIRALADWLDTRFAIPGTNIRFGFDSIIGLVPGIGDAITTALGAYILFRAHELGAPRTLMARMAVNLAIDSLVGAVPIFGDIFDLAFKSHLKNVRLLLGWLEKRDEAARDVTPR